MTTQEKSGEWYYEKQDKQVRKEQATKQLADFLGGGIKINQTTTLSSAALCLSHQKHIDSYK